MAFSWGAALFSQAALCLIALLTVLRKRASCSMQDSGSRVRHRLSRFGDISDRGRRRPARPGRLLTMNQQAGAKIELRSLRLLAEDV